MGHCSAQVPLQDEDDDAVEYDDPEEDDVSRLYCYQGVVGVVLFTVDQIHSLSVPVRPGALKILKKLWIQLDPLSLPMSQTTVEPLEAFHWKGQKKALTEQIRV